MDNAITEPFKVCVSPDGVYVKVYALQHAITLDLAVSFTKQFTKLGAEHNLKRCLIDIRGNTSKSGISGKYEYAYDKAVSAGLTRDWKTALLKDANDISPDFIETVMNNSGHTFKIFDDDQEALGWLSA